MSSSTHVVDHVHIPPRRGCVCVLILHLTISFLVYQYLGQLRGIVLTGFIYNFFLKKIGKFPGICGIFRYFLNRAQPPLLSSTLMLLLPYITDDDKLVVLGKILLNLAFPQRQVQRATAAIVKEYDTVWKSTPRYDEITGLSKWESFLAERSVSRIQFSS